MESEKKEGEKVNADNDVEAVLEHGARVFGEHPETRVPYYEFYYGSFISRYCTRWNLMFVCTF